MHSNIYFLDQLRPVWGPMKIFVYDYREHDEKQFFEKYTKEMGMEMHYTLEHLSPENVDLAKGCEFVSIFTTPCTAPMLDRFKEIGVKMICTRCIGFDHIDINHAKEIGMVVTNITYDTEGVAEFTVMDILMAVRRVKELYFRTMENDFRLNGMLARQLKDMSVGIVGAGKIGISVLRNLSGFGCKLYYCNRSRNEDADKYAERIEMDELLERCDIVSLHLELNDATYHIMGKENIAKMKDGAILINTARGALVDTEELISALESGHLTSAALDVVEGEFGLYYNDCSDMDLENHFIGRLRKMPNVIFTHHMAYYYTESVRDMVYNCLYGMKMYSEGKKIPFRLA